MARMRKRAGVAAEGQGEKKRAALQTIPKEPARPAAAEGMDKSSRLVVTSLMFGLLGLFLLIGVLAPDTLQGEGRPGGATIAWRLLFLLVPLAVMYGLLWGESFLEFFKPSKARKKS